MKFAKGIDKRYRKSVTDALDTIIELGLDEHRRVARAILESDLLVRVEPVSAVRASGVTGLIDPRKTSSRIDRDNLSIVEALGEVYISIAEETIDTGGQRGCEGTFVHEGRHAYDFARMISSFSNSELNPLSIFDPTLYELELAAHETSGRYMLQINKPEYIEEGIDLLILGERGGMCFLNDDGIRRRLSENYGLNADEKQGRNASTLTGLNFG